MPPVAVAVMVPSLALHEAGDVEVVNVGPARLSTVTAIVLIQPLASFTYSVYTAPGIALKIAEAW